MINDLGTNQHIQVFSQELVKFRQFGDSLLTRSTKLTELIGSLEAALETNQKGPESLEGKRVTKPLPQLFNSNCQKALLDGCPVQYRCHPSPLQLLLPKVCWSIGVCLHCACRAVREVRTCEAWCFGFGFGQSWWGNNKGVTWPIMHFKGKELFDNIW